VFKTREFEDIKILAQDLQEHDIIITDGGKYISEVFIINPIFTSSGTVIEVMSKGMLGGADEFKFKADTLIEVSRRKSNV
jgi:hypothetical protein